MESWDLASLKSVNLDFEKWVFQINGVDIKHCTDVDISFHKGEWSVSVGVGARFNPRGERKRSTATS